MRSTLNSPQINIKKMGKNPQKPGEPKNPCASFLLILNKLIIILNIAVSKHILSFENKTRT